MALAVFQEDVSRDVSPEQPSNVDSNVATCDTSQPDTSNAARFEQLRNMRPAFVMEPNRHTDVSRDVRPAQPSNMPPAFATCAMAHGMTAVLRDLQPWNRPCTVVAASPTSVRSIDSMPDWKNTLVQSVIPSAFRAPLNDTLPSLVSLANAVYTLLKSAMSRFARSMDFSWLYSGSVVLAEENAFFSVDEVLTPGSNDTDLM